MAKQAAIEPKQSDKKEWALLIRQTKFTELKKMRSHKNHIYSGGILHCSKSRA